MVRSPSGANSSGREIPIGETCRVHRRLLQPSAKQKQLSFGPCAHADILVQRAVELEAVAHRRGKLFCVIEKRSHVVVGVSFYFYVLRYALFT